MGVFRNMKLAVRLGLVVTLVLLVGFFTLWKIVDMKSVSMVNEQIGNQMTDAVESRAAIINDYVESAEEYLEAFAKSDEVHNTLLYPDNAKYRSRAQAYTVDFANVKGVFEGLYIADANTLTLTHTSEAVVGITTRTGDALKSLQDTVFTKEQVWNLGIVVSPGSGNLVISMYYPIFEKSQCIGFVGAAVYASQLMDSLLELDINGLPESEYVFLNASNGTYLYNEDAELINTETTNPGYLQMLARVKEDPKNLNGSITYQSENGEEEVVVYRSIPERGWIFGVKDKKENVFAAIGDIRMVTALVCGVIGCAVVVILLFLITSVGHKLRKVERAIRQVGEMELTKELGLKAYMNQGDEIGIICNALERTCKNLMAYISEANDRLSAMANGDFTRDENAGTAFMGEFVKLQSSMEEIQKSLRMSFSQIGTATQEVSLGAQTVSSSANSLAEAATNQNMLVIEIDDHVNEITEQLANSAEHASLAKEQTAQAAELVNESKEKMKELTGAMQRIAESAAAIEGISGNLEKIAKQTNILSLNALVEAQRVGEAGKSFGVVANEIRNLAEESNHAARNAFELITQTLEAVNYGSELTQETAQCLYKVVEQTTTIDNSVSEIAMVAHQQNEKLNGIKNRLRDISRAVETTTAMAEQEAAASHELDSMANVLEQNLKQYRV